MIDGMRKKQKEEFLKWHAEAKAAANGVFNFREQMMTYCSNDVTVLRVCALKFISDYQALTSLNPMESMTMPSACYRYWRMFHLPENKVAALSSHGPHRNRRTSIQATQWLEWENMSANGRIRHGRNGKEVKIGRYFVDGFDKETQTVYEYNGCVFHGHPFCTEENDVVPYSKKKMREVYEEFQERERFLESQGYTVEVKWSCEWLKERQDPDIAAFLLNMNIREPMNPRDAFKGGRTNASRLYYQVKDDEEIRHYDVVSLYPFVNKTKAYPVGHPEVIVSNFKDAKDYFGLVYCKVAAPDQCLYPVLPATINGKLMFVLCKKCAMEKALSRCAHTDDDRCFEGVWATPELHHAIDVGYRVVEMYEVWHWTQSDTKLFAAYMDKFLKVKMEASGWPAWCDTDEKKAKFIQTVKEREGISLDPDAMVFDAGKKSTTKIVVNSLWGKTGQSCDMNSTEFVYDPKRYSDLCRSKAIEIHDVYGVSPTCLMVTHSKVDDYNEGSNGTNVVIAAFTTSHARLILLSLMEKLGERLLYYDTDSVIFIHRPGDWLPDTGSILGDWDNQLEAGENHIVKFVSCGPKVYSYETDTGRIELKVKGMMQNGFTEDILDWDSVTKELTRTGKALDFNQLKRLLDGVDGHVQVVYPEYIKRNGKTQEINTVQLAKKLKLVYDKRIMLDDFTTLPFGTR
ncbi:uncharacterized protein LOC129598801 [Paramacrobiotus metropolitanus]|uniref:uncharacterized protein LOC129598801 n=1 Tax=Paramacrobiotus metropolitanus TaxID=2943436 RepID=UPI0024461BDA|nr:uncharacterized protein LOC129598801 [Paramacrobiotus metropolitanus]